ncbi:hypothetical protein F5B21DRAFT_498814 [Xylaria acuta]|nr:hypothetical protein F5B21DRAFT_498814 [Xylaria acuta]
MSSTKLATSVSTSTPFSEDRLRDALDGIIARRFFAGWNEIEQSRETRDPQIDVDGVGRIHLPLSEEQARQIISKAYRSPFGHGSRETIVDTAAVQQDAWELDPQSFTITARPRWDELLKEFLTVISRTLGISNRIVRADLHKFSEKIPHMFGTLVISLPSHHRGGDVIVRHLDQEAVFSTYKHAMAGVYWYSDASHEVLPLEFGYRWVLTYNLITTVSLEKPLESPGIGNGLLRDVVESWTRANSSDDTKPFYYALDNKYEEANLSRAGLKSRDEACLEQLQLLQACHDLDFHIFLANLELEDVREEDIREMDDDPENQYPSLYVEDDSDTVGSYVDSILKAEYVYDLNGNEVLPSVTIDEDSIMRGDLFGEYPDNRMYNENVTSYYYRSSALVIVPPKALGPFLASCGSDMLGYSSDPKPIMVLNYCIDRCQSSNSESALDVLLQLLEKTGKPDQLDWTGYTALAGKLYELAITCHGSELINWVTRYALPLPLTVLGWLRRQFEIFAISFERLNIGFSSVIQTRKSLNDQYQVVLTFRADTDAKDELLELINDTPTKTIGDGSWGSSRSYEDGLALYNLALCAHNGFELMKSAIIPNLVGTCGQNTEFMLGFVHGWHQGMQREITLTDSQPIYENLVRVTVRNMSIPLLAVEGEEAHDSKRPRKHWDSGPSPTPLASYGILYSFVVSLFQPCLEEQRDIFMKKITLEAASINGAKFENLWIPLLQSLLSDSEKLEISLSDQSWQKFYQTILESFLLSYVGKALPNPDFVRKPVSCSCNECRELNQFLLDPTQRVRSFNRPTPSQRTHFLQMFPSNRNDCTNSGNPHNVIAKIEDPKIERERNSRERRKLKAAKHLRAFDSEKLRTALAGRYDAVMTMSFLERPEDTATTSSLTSSSTRRREPLAPMSTNQTAAIAPPESEKTFSVDNTPSSAQLQAGGVGSPYGLPIAYITPNQPINRSAATVRTQTFASPQTTMSGIGRDGLSMMPSTHPQLEAMRNLISSAPDNLRWQEFGSPFIVLPYTAAIRSSSNPSRPPPSTVIQHPVAGAKRKMVEFIDLTTEDD